MFSSPSPSKRLRVELDTDDDVSNSNDVAPTTTTTLIIVDLNVEAARPTALIRLEPREKRVDLKQHVANVKRGMHWKNEEKTMFLYNDVYQRRSAHCIDMLFADYYLETDLDNLKETLAFVVDADSKCGEPWDLPYKAFDQNTIKAIKYYLKQCQEQNYEITYEEFMEVTSPLIKFVEFNSKLSFEASFFFNGPFFDLQKLLPFKSLYELNEIIETTFDVENTDSHIQLLKLASETLGRIAADSKENIDSIFTFIRTHNIKYKDMRIKQLERKGIVLSNFLKTLTKRMALEFTTVFHDFGDERNGHILIYSYNVFNWLLKPLLLIQGSDIDLVAFLMIFIRVVKYIEFAKHMGIGHTNHYSYRPPSISFKEFEALLSLISKASFEKDDIINDKDKRKWVLVEVLLILKTCFGVEITIGEDCLVLKDTTGFESKIEMRYKDELFRRLGERETENGGVGLVNVNYEEFKMRFDVENGLEEELKLRAKLCGESVEDSL